VGPKLAERLVLELKSKAAQLGTAGFSIATAHAGDAPAGKTKKAPAASSIVEDALSALVHLGYGRSEAFSVVMRLQAEKPDSKLDALIRESLRELAA